MGNSIGSLVIGEFFSHYGLDISHSAQRHDGVGASGVARRADKSG
jgi:hypothetical protein